MKYFVRSVKYMLFLCVLYVGLEWLMLEFAPDASIEGMTLGELLMVRLSDTRGMMLIVAIVALAALYPLFGFMKSSIKGCSYERDAARINNAMHLYGFKLIEDNGDIKIYGADTFLRRLTLMFEDRIEVRCVEDGIELKGMRRTVARITYQLQTYLHNSRFEE